MNLISSTMDNTADIKTDKIVSDIKVKEKNSLNPKENSKKIENIQNEVKENNGISELDDDNENKHKNKDTKENLERNNINSKKTALEKSKDNDENNKIQNDALTKEKYNKTEDIAVFKVNKNTLADNISLKEKSKLLYFSSKLSTIDYGTIMEYMKSDDELWAATKIFKLLKTRLPLNDYKKIKDILEPYLEIDIIESEIRNQV